MKTYLLVQLDSEGAAFSDVATIVEDLGFRLHTAGGYDFVYVWDRPAAVRDSLELADRLQAALKGQRVYFRLESTEE